MANSMKIKKGVKIPPGSKGGGRRKGEPQPAQSKYPWHYMEVGDALCLGEDEERKMTNALTAANHNWHARNEGWRFASRKVDGLIYIWRIR